MPIIPSTYATLTPITAHQLNQDMFTYDGSFFGGNGTFFHSNRPILLEAYATNSVIQASKGGSVTLMAGTAQTQGLAFSILDNAGLYGSGSDFPGDAASFSSAGAIAPGSNGVAGQYGGWMLFTAFVPLTNFSGTGNDYGVVWYLNALGSPLQDIGCITQGSSTRSNCGFAVDLIQRQFQAGITASGSVITTTPAAIYQPAVAALDPAGTTVDVVANTGSTNGQTARFMELWMGVSNGNGLTVATIPVPLSTVTTSTTLSSSTLNTTIQQTFNLLNNPPLLNVQNQNTGSITANSITACPFNFTPLVDNYSRYSTSSTHYIVPLPGMYFCHANIIYNTAFTVGSAMAGFQVNGTNYWGGAYNATPPAKQNTGASVTKLLDLNAGDTVSTVTEVSVGCGFGFANVSHFIMAWMCPISTSKQSWVPPDVTGFQFQAGTQPGTAATQLGGLMNVKIANDINFLLNRPYLTVHQTTAQTGLSQNTWSTIKMQSTVGTVHGSLGDNYAGWSTANNWYVAPVNGWYMVMGEVNAATTSTASSGNQLVAGFSVPTSGGVTSPATDNNGHAGQPDWYQQIMVTNSWTFPTMATGIGMYYLLAGETIQPCAMYQASATWSTDVTNRSGTAASHFDVIWMSN